MGQRHGTPAMSGPQQEAAAIRLELERLRQALHDAGRRETRDQESRAAERLRHESDLAASESRSAEARLDAQAAGSKAAALAHELGRVMADGLARLRVSQANIASLERVNAALAAGRATVAARAAELHTILDSAVSLGILATDTDGQVLFWNAGAERLLGLDPTRATPLSVAEVLPVEEAPDGSVGRMVAAALRGERQAADAWRIRRGGDPIWLGVEAMPLGDPGAAPVGVLWLLRDRTAAHLVEHALRHSEERQAFLLRLSDTLLPLSDPALIEGEACRLLAERLEVDRACYVEVDEAAGTARVRRDFVRGDAASLAGEHRIADFAWPIAILSRGECPVVGDTRSSAIVPDRHRPATAALGIVACMAAPLIEAGRLAGALCVAQARARDWARHETELLRDVGERIRAAAERARAEAALRESEERFRGFAENSADVLWITSADGSRLDYLSPAFERTFGESRQRILADLGRFRDLVHPEDHAAVEGFLPRALAGESAIAHYRVIRPSDGRIVHLRDTGFPIRDASGAVAHVAGIVQDITDLHAAGAAVEAEKERFRTLAEGIPELVWRAAPDGAWTWASPQWQAHTGQTPEASIGLGWLDALHPEDRAAAQAAWAEAAQAGLYSAEFRLRHAATGAYAWFQTRGAPVRDAAGTLVEWIGACANIDEQVRMRETLERSAEELDARVRERTAELMAAEATLRQAQKMEAIGQLTGGIAHDFNNMLQGVVGGLDMASRRLAEGRPADVARYAAAARDAAVRAAGLTRRLLAFARRQQLEPRPVNPDALLRGMEDLLRRSVGPAIAVELLRRDGAFHVLCDPSELESAVLNLCINARDAMPDGGRLVIATEDVALRAADIARHEEAEPGEFVSIRIRDSGTGMTPEVLDRVLEPFFTTKPQGQGTGLGLSQVYGFVRQSAGLLRIASTPGEGTTVQILLPRKPGAAASDGAAPPAAAGEHAPQDQVVLMVDDETAVREPAAARLRDLGYRVIEAENGPRAMQLLEDGLRPDILVTDVGLPQGMDGRAVAEAVRRRWPGLPVVFATGYARVALPDDAAVVTKPFDLDTLAARIGETLRHAH
jgi:PAS domain S-box-containing protein